MSVKASTLTLMVSFGLLAGCAEKNTYAPPPPAHVTVAQPLQKSVTEYLEFTGTTRSVATVEVRARVAGVLERMDFTPGTEVARRQLLFVIDPREYEAELAAAVAELESARAELKRAGIELGRAQRLYKQKAGSESDVVKWRGEQEVAKAAIMRNEAKVEKARLNLSYTQVSAPIAGRVGRNLVDPGNLVGEGEPTLLTTVTDYTPMYAYFNLNERDLLTAMGLYKTRLREMGVPPDESSIRQARIPLYLGLANEEGYPHQGLVDYAASEVDPDTGTLQMRGVFSNDETPPELIPGLFARLRMPIRVRPDALLVTERAIGADQGGRYLLVVNKDDVVEKRSVRTGQPEDGLLVIEEGVGPGDRVIVRGLQRARPGAKVAPQRVEMASLSTSARQAAAREKANAPTIGEQSRPPRSPSPPQS